MGTTEYAEHTESRLRACLKTRGLKQNYVRAMTNCRRFTAIWTALTNLQPIHRFSKRLLDRASAQGRVNVHPVGQPGQLERNQDLLLQIERTVSVQHAEVIVDTDRVAPG